jgi:hypothetical protein
LKSLINIQTSEEKHVNTTLFMCFLLAWVASFLAFVAGDDSGSLDCASLVFDPGGNPGHFQSYCLDAFNFSAVVSVFTETTQWFKWYGSLEFFFALVPWIVFSVKSCVTLVGLLSTKQWFKLQKELHFLG